MSSTETRPENDKNITEYARRIIAATWYGSVLIRSTAMMGMVTTYVTAIALLWDKIQASFKNTPSGQHWLLWVLLLFPLLFIGLFSVGPELWRRLARWRRNRRALSIDLSTPQAAYFRLDPYVPDTPEAFIRIDAAHLRVLRWLRETSDRVLFLSGTSGCGKSSLLEGYIIPMLERDGWKIRRVRAFEQRDLAAALDASTGGVTKQLTVFDQFEEFLILEDRSRSEQRDEFVRQMQRIAEDTAASGKFLFVARSDYLQGMIELKIGELESNMNWLVVEPFRRPAARAFLQASPLKPSASLVEEMLDGASAVEETNGFFRAITLNILGLVLQTFDGAVTRSPARLIQDYLKDAISQRGIQPIAPLVVRQMTTDAGTKRQVSIGEICDASKLSEGEVKLSLVLLSAKGLVRSLDPARQVWEISHDFVAKQLSIIVGNLTPPSWQRSARLVAVASFVITLLALGQFATVSAMTREQEALARLKDLQSERFFLLTQAEILRGQQLRAEANMASLREEQLMREIEIARQRNGRPAPVAAP